MSDMPSFSTNGRGFDAFGSGSGSGSGGGGEHCPHTIEPDDGEELEDTGSMSCQRSTAIARLNRQTITDANDIREQILFGDMTANLLSSVNQIFTDYENNLSIIDNEFPDESIAGAAGAPDASATALARSNEALAGLNDVEERHEILAEDVGGLRDDVESLTGEVEVLGDNLQDLAGDVNELDNNAEVLRDDVDALAEDFGGVRKEVNVFADDVETLAVNVNDLEDNANALDENVDVIGQQGEENEQRISALEMAVQQLQAENNGTNGDQETMDDDDDDDEDEEDEEETTDELQQEDDDDSQTATGSDDDTLGGDNLNDTAGQVETEVTRTNVAQTRYRVTRGKYEGAVGIIEGEKGLKVRLLFTTPFNGMVRTLGTIKFGQLEELAETDDDDGEEDAEEEDANQDEE